MAAALALLALAAPAAAAPDHALADASGLTDASACATPQLTQAFQKQADFNWYAYAPGMSAGAVDPAGWTLTGGATVQQKKTPTGAIVYGPLTLPGGATAVSPTMCVSSDFSQVRALVKNLNSTGGGGVTVSASYLGATGWSAPQRVGSLNGPDTAWDLANAVKLSPTAASGWQLVQLTLSVANAGSTPTKGYQLSDLVTQASPQGALASVDTSACAAPQLSQSLMAGKDFNWYTPAPGQSAAGFDGTGWTLSNGAKVVPAQMADGRTGSVLSLPNKAKAVSPLMCVSSDYAVARAQIRSLTSGSTGGVQLDAAIKGTTSWNNPRTSNLGGNNTDWRPSGNGNLGPVAQPGYQLVQITLISSTDGKGYQVSDLGARASTQAALDAVGTSACSRHGLSQPFLAGGDANWYAMAPGMSTDSVDASEWTLSGGASVASTRLADGAFGSVLDLPAGAKAVSPFMCISSDYQIARAQIRSLVGGSGGVTMAAQIKGTTTWNNPQTISLGTNSTAWTLSNTANLSPADANGWQLVQVTLTNTSSANEFQLYDVAAQASASLALSSVDTSACVPPDLSQPFLWAGDSRWYMQAPGVTVAGFDGTGWTLTGGASIVQAPQPDGSIGPVLDLPPGSQAVAPVMCVTADYPLARAQMRQDTDGAVSMYVAYNGTTTWNNPDKSADIHGPGKGAWGLTGNANINPGKDAGWQLVQITLAPRDNNHSQIYDFQIDPRMR